MPPRSACVWELRGRAKRSLGMDPREPYRPIGENPDPTREPPTPVDEPAHEEPPVDDPAPDSTNPLPRSADLDPAHDAGAAPDD